MGKRQAEATGVPGEIRFTATERDYVDANRDWYRATLKGRRGLVRLGFPVLTAVVVGAILSLLDGDAAAFPWTLAVYVLLGILVVILIHATCYLTLPWQARRLFRQQKSLHQPLRFRWSSHGLDTEARTGSSHHDWADFHRWFVGRKTLLLFVNDRLFIFLPRHRLDDAAVDELRSLVAGAGVRSF